MALKSQTVAALRKLLEEKGLDTKGTKAQLLERLAATDTKRARDDEEDDEPPAKRSAASETVKDRLRPPPEPDAWTTEDTLIYLDDAGVAPTGAVYGFDMDSTLIETRSGKTFPQSRKDWKWLFPGVPDRLRALHGEGKKIVIITNQGGINGKGGFSAAKAAEIKGKIDDLKAELGIPLQALIATSDDIYRKPSTAMWDFIASHMSHSTPPDKRLSAFVGDGAGRPAGWKPGRKKDFSCSDRKFAYNIGISFFTPEEFFLKEAPGPFDWEGVDPAAVTAMMAPGGDVVPGGDARIAATAQEVVVFVGWPGSGKSTFAERYLLPRGYVHVNRDTLKTPAKCLKTAEDALKAGKSVVVDNTCPDQETRAPYLKLAGSYGVPARCFHFQSSRELANHLNYLRERKGDRDHVPRIAFASYNKKFEEPSTAEGFTEVVPVSFKAVFGSDADRDLFRQLC